MPNDQAKSEAKAIFEFIVSCYPDMLIGQKLFDTSTTRAIYYYGALGAVLKAEMKDQYVQMHLLNLLRDQLGITAEQLAAEIMKAIDPE
jgi:hypothetical protein